MKFKTVWPRSTADPLKRAVVIERYLNLLKHFFPGWRLPKCTEEVYKARRMGAQFAPNSRALSGSLRKPDYGRPGREADGRMDS